MIALIVYGAAAEFTPDLRPSLLSPPPWVFSERVSEAVFPESMVMSWGKLDPFGTSLLEKEKGRRISR